MSKRDGEMEATSTFKKMEMDGTELSKTYKKMAASILKELETSLGRELPEVEQFMFVHGTAECRSASMLQKNLSPLMSFYIISFVILLIFQIA